MLILLPFVVFAGAFLSILGTKAEGENDEIKLTYSFIKTAILTGAFQLLLLEGLSLIDGITQVGLALSWGVVLLVIWYWGLQSERIQYGLDKLRAAVQLTDWMEKILAAGIILVVLLLFVIAIASPPNNVDSLLYHMPRVVHWAQNQTLAHFPTFSPGQLNKPIFVESTILNLRVLWGSDRPVNLVQWSAMVGSLILVMGISRFFGVSRRGQLLAAAFAVSIPIGILQSTTTKNDYVIGFWLGCLIYLVLLRTRRELRIWEIGLFGLTLGLGILSKGTFFPYAFPVVVWFFLLELRKSGFFKLIRAGIVVGVLVCFVNLGFWIRNVNTFGGLYGTPGGLEGVLQIDELFSIFGIDREIDSGDSTLLMASLNSDRMPQVPRYLETNGSGVGDGSSQSDDPKLQGSPFFFQVDGESGGGFIDSFLSQLRDLGIRLARNMGQNAIMPTGWLHSRLMGFLRAFPSVFDTFYVDSLETGLWNQEDTTGNFFHLIAILISISGSIIICARKREYTLLVYVIVLFLGYFSLGFISYSANLYGIRYQLAYFLLNAPVVAIVFAEINKRYMPMIVGLTFVLLALPYVFLNYTRPIVGIPPRTRNQSIFVTSQATTLFAMAHGRQDEYEAVAETILEEGCTQVGLRIKGRDFEYLWWGLFESPQSNIRLEAYGAAPMFDQYVDPDFKPCAVIYSWDTDAIKLEGFNLQADYGHVKLYLENGG